MCMKIYLYLVRTQNGLIFISLDLLVSCFTTHLVFFLLPCLSSSHLSTLPCTCSVPVTVYSSQSHRHEAALSQKPLTLWLCLHRRAVGFVRDSIPNMAVHLLDVVRSRGRDIEGEKESRIWKTLTNQPPTSLRFQARLAARSSLVSLQNGSLPNVVIENTWRKFTILMWGCSYQENQWLLFALLAL